MSQHILKPTISADDVIRWHCCYENSRVRKLLPEPQSLTVLLKRADISPQDRVWLATRPGVLSDWVLFNFAANCAERALRAAKVTDERCWRVVEHARERARGAERDNGVAEDAAAYAARDAARFDVAGSYAARAAAYVCVAPQADAAATCTSDYAADARAATAYAARDAAAQERAEQVADLLRLIESEEAA